MSPRCDFASTDNYLQRDAFAMACGPARDYLLGARRFDTLEEALEGCNAAVAFTARSSRARMAVAKTAPSRRKHQHLSLLRIEK